MERLARVQRGCKHHEIALDVSTQLSDVWVKGCLNFFPRIFRKGTGIFRCVYCME